MIRLDVAAFEDFAQHMQIPSRDYGLVPLALWGSQRHIIREIAAGLERDVHDFVILKGGRQIGGTTVIDGLTLWWPQANDGTQGMLVSDDDGNRDYRRDVILAMNESLPKSYRLPLKKSNALLARWSNGSRLAFQAVGTRRSKSNLGRSRGVNYLEADEVGDWPDLKAASALKSSLSERHPARLYTWNSTARGIGTPFHDMWKAAQLAKATRAIFSAWWMHEGYVLTEDQVALWDAYAVDELSSDERLWVRTIEERYGHRLTAGQIGWYRYKLAEAFFGDETMMAQEFGSLPEECFQSFGDKFIGPHRVLELRLALPDAPTPTGYRYEFGRHLDETELHIDDVADAQLIIWNEPEKDGVYVVAGHPARSSSPDAAEFVIQVWRVWPDSMAQVATFRETSMSMYQFAWTLLHLAGAYRTFVPAYFIMEIGGPGRRVLEEIHLIQRVGYGLSPHKSRVQVQDFLGSVTHYFYHRPDLVSSRATAIEWATQSNNRAWLLHGLGDTVERGHMVVRDEALVDALAGLRRGEEGDDDHIAAGGEGNDAHAITAALAVECWMHTAMYDLPNLIAPREVTPSDPQTVEARLVQGFLGNLLRR